MPRSSWHISFPRKDVVPLVTTTFDSPQRSGWSNDVGRNTLHLGADLKTSRSRAEEKLFAATHRLASSTVAVLRAESKEATKVSMLPSPERIPYSKGTHSVPDHASVVCESRPCRAL